MLLPSRTLISLSSVWLAIAAASVLAWLPPSTWQLTGLLLAAALVADASLLLKRPIPGVRREASASFAAGRWHEVRLRLTNSAAHEVTVELIDHFPARFEARNLPARVRLPAHGWVELQYGLRSVSRGAFQFAPAALRLRSPFGLLERQVRAGDAQAVQVYPDFGALAGYALLATDHRLSQIGILQRRRRGEGMDFHQLREYRIGDSLRRIDWKASSRMHRLISRDYQDERDQAIMLLIDCGRRMSAHDGEFSHFDAALNAALLLAHVGLHHGDAVGAMTMSTRTRFIAPRKSRSTVNLLLRELYDLQPSDRPSDHHIAALELMQRVRKRALVIVLSNLRDEDDDTLWPALELMRRRHLVLFASLREHVLGEALSAPVSGFDSALAHAAAAEYLRERMNAFSRIERCGAQMLDVEPQELPLALVNRYLDIKRSGVL